MIVGDILTRNARKHAERIAVCHGEITMTYGTLEERSNRLANALIALGTKKGDRLGIFLRNTYQVIEIYFAAAKTGAIFCPFNIMYREKELVDIINYSTPKFLFFEDASVPLIEAVRSHKKAPSHYVLVSPSSPSGKNGSSFLNYETLIQEGEHETPPVKIIDDDVISIFFTSGTTGKPMGAMKTHRQVITAGYTTAIEERISYNERVLMACPMYHVSFESSLGRCFLFPNTEVIWGEVFDPQRILETMSRERVTVGVLFPTMLNALIRYPDISEFDLSSLRLIVYAGAPMPVQFLKKALSIFQKLGVSLIQHYGLTESGPSMTVLPPEDHVLDESDKRFPRLASAGRPVLDCHIRIVDTMGRDVAPGVVGEIIGKSETIMKGYWNLPDATARKIRDGWLYTGDLGRFDEDGYIYLVDRKGDMIIRGDKNVYPREIEEVLHMFPGILEAVVIGIPDDLWGESIKGLVVMREGITVSGRDIINFCGNYLADYKKPQSIEFCKTLPRTPQGKVLKRVLKEKYWAGSGRTL